MPATATLHGVAFDIWPTRAAQAVRQACPAEVTAAPAFAKVSFQGRTVRQTLGRTRPRSTKVCCACELESDAAVHCAVIVRFDRTIQSFEAPALDQTSRSVLDTRLRGYDSCVWTRAFAASLHLACGSGAAALPLLARKAAKPLRFRGKVLVARLPNGLKSAV